MVLNSDGRVELNYYNMIGEVNSATIGVQGSDADEFVLVSFDNNYAENNLTTNIIPKAEWLTISPLSGNLIPGTNQNINLDMDTSDLIEGTYYDIISIQTNDYNNYLFDIPVILNITDTCGQWSNGDANNDNNINVQDVVLIVNFILGTSVGDECQSLVSDLNGDGLVNVQDIILLVNTILS